MLGVLLVDKPIGMTSHDVVNRVRRALGTRRVGHAGTLDPLATGVLVVAVGPATRFLQYLPLEPKEYVAEVAFGRATTTFDAEGETLAEAAVPEDLDARIESGLPTFLGLIKQTPPMYSAVKVGGQPLYKAARRGEEVERPSRQVHIATFETVAAEGDTRTMRIVCSGGTYVRTLAHDLGTAIGVPCHLSGLRRVAVGRFREADTVPLEGVSAADLRPLGESLDPMPRLILDPSEVRSVREGRALRREDAPTTLFVALCDERARVVSVARVEGPVLRPECVIPAETMPRCAFLSPPPAAATLRGSLTLSLGWVFVTAVGLCLTPDAQGHGTHQRLGLPPCPSVLLFDRPCPGCGLTTSWTALLHGDLSLAFHAHPLGPFLYLGYTAFAFGTFALALRRRRWIDGRWTTPAFSALFAVFLGFGLIRMALTPNYATVRERMMVGQVR